MDLSGYLHVDGYAVYNKLEPDVILCECWAHLRRKFDEALVVLPQKDAESTSAKGLAYCYKLFEIEKDIMTLAMSP